jgi:hypothetical protein
MAAQIGSATLGYDRPAAVVDVVQRPGAIGYAEDNLPAPSIYCTGPPDRTAALTPFSN